MGLDNQAFTDIKEDRNKFQGSPKSRKEILGGVHVFVKQAISKLSPYDPLLHGVNPFQSFGPGQIVQEGPHRFKSFPQQGGNDLVSQGILKPSESRHKGIQHVAVRLVCFKASDPPEIRSGSLYSLRRSPENPGFLPGEFQQPDEVLPALTIMGHRVTP